MTSLNKIEAQQLITAVQLLIAAVQLLQKDAYSCTSITKENLHFGKFCWSLILDLAECFKMID